MLPRGPTAPLRRTKTARKVALFDESLLTFRTFNNMAALCGVVKVMLSFFRHGEEGAVERHRSRLTVNFDEQRNISIFKNICAIFLV